MKKLIFLLILLIPLTAFAQPIRGKLLWTDPDGTPTQLPFYEITVSSGTLADDGDGTGTLTTGGAGDVTSASNITDHSIVRGDGGVKGVQESGILIDDNDNLTTTGIIDLNPAHTDTANIIDITPTAALSNANAEWDGININLDALDPSAIDVLIHGIHIDMSGVSVAQDPELEGIHILGVNSAHPSIHIDKGKYRHDFTPSTNAFASHTVLDIIINASSQDPTSDTHILDVALANGLSGTVEALSTHPGVDVIHQHVGTFVGFADGFGVIYTKIGDSYADFTDEDIWAADDDGFVVGHTSTFDEIELAFDVTATKDVRLQFYYWKAAGWFEFFPEDDTDGGRNNGTIRFDGADLTDWLSADPTGAAGDTGYWMKIERTRVSDPGTVNLSTHRYLMATEYSWDKDGDVSIRSLIVNEQGEDVDTRFEGDTEANLLYINAGTDRVGIGTTTPGAKLTVKEDGFIMGIGSSGLGSGANFYSNTTTYYGTTVDASIVFMQNSNERMRIKATTGNVGIGTTNPEAKLEVAGKIYTTDGGISSDNGAIEFMDASGSGLASIYGYSGGLALSAWSVISDAQHVYINPNGKVGIGTTAPREELEILDNAALASESLTDGNFAAFDKWTDANDFNEGTGNYVYLHSTGAGTLTQANADLTIKGIKSRWYKFVYTVSSVTENGTLAATITTAFGESAVTLTVNANATKSVIFESDSAASTADFVISATSTDAGDTFTLDDLSLKEITGGDLIVNGIITGGGTTGIKVLSNGNVGIGTTSPEKKLHVYRGDSTGAFDFSTVLAIENSNQAFVQILVPDNVDASSGFIIGTNANGNIAGIFHNPVTGLSTIRGDGANTIIMEGGKVGIGTTSPDVDLDVEGSTGISIGEDKAGGGSNDEGILKLWSDGDNAFSTTIKTGTQTQNITYTLPLDDGDANEVMSTNGAGVLDWVAGGAGFWTDLAPNLEPNDDGDGIQINDSTGNDFVVQSHDGTDYNFVSTNTTQYTFDLPIQIGGTAQSTITEGLVVNDGGGADVDDDFRVETDTEDNFLWVDAGSNLMRIGDGDTNYIQITSGGALTLVGGASITGDITGNADTVTTVSAGDYAAASIDGDDINSNLAGRSLTLTAGSPDTLDVDVELYTDTKCIWFENPTAADDFESIWANKTAGDYTLTEMWGESDQTVVFNLKIDDGTPADVNSADLTAAAGEVEDTSLDGDTTLAAGEELDLKITSVTNTPTWCSICWTYVKVD